MDEQDIRAQPSSATPSAITPASTVIRRIATMTAIQAVILFGVSGRIGWAMAWVYLALETFFASSSIAFLRRHRPDLAEERLQVKQDAKQWDIILATAVSAYLPIITLIVAALDMRFGWTGAFPLWWSLVGVGVMLLGFALVMLAMRANAFFSGLVRIQSDRSHTVADAGPYRVVRHPGYVGTTLVTVAGPLILGSAWALLPAGVNIALIVLRTKLEDDTLRSELDGYAAYTHRVRSRLLPGIW